MCVSDEGPRLRPMRLGDKDELARLLGQPDIRAQIPTDQIPIEIPAPSAAARLLEACCADDGEPTQFAVLDAGRPGVLAAWASLQPEPGSPGVLEVGIGVDGASRRTGVGRRAVLQLLDRARELGADRVLATVTSANTGSLRLFRGLGFSEEAPGQDPTRLWLTLPTDA